MLWLTSKLRYFNRDDRLMLMDAVTAAAFSALSEANQNQIRHMFSFINATTTANSLASVVDYCREVFLEGKGPFIMVINEGESGFITEQKEEGADYSGHKLVIRENSTGALISDPSFDGTDQEFQEIPIVDLQLASPGIYRVRIQLEESTDDVANGEAVALLSTAYLIVPLSIDTNEG